MIEALLASQRAMDIDQLKLQNISHNISNMNTPGFKQQVFTIEASQMSQEPRLAALMHACAPEAVMSQGTLNQTHRLYDLALSGEGFFQVQGETDVFYTRRGDFHVNQEGMLSLATGEVLLGQNGPIEVGDQAFTINTRGELFIEHHKVDEIQYVSLDKHDLTSVGNGLYQTHESPMPHHNATHILQGYSEQANVKSIDEMMELVKTSRHFETTQRIMHTADLLLGSAINQLGESNV